MKSAVVRRRLRSVPRHLVLIALSLIMIYPLGVVLITSLKTNTEVLLNPTGLPRNPTFDNFIVTWREGNFANLFTNSILLTVTSMIGATAIASLAAYAIVRKVTKVGTSVYLLLAAGIFLPMQLAIIPQFRVVRDLGLIDNYLSVILIYVVGAIPFGTFLMAGFMRQIPREIVEAATADGAGYFQLYVRIFLPLARPAIVSYWILHGVSVWNDYLIPMLFLADPNKRTLTTGVLAFKQQYLAQWGNLMAGVVLMSVPVIVLFIVAQRYFVRGLYAGAVK
jgi:ABC-type glycerol-3-phosphate transport system permease component